MRPAAVAASLLSTLLAAPAMALDLTPLWDFARPELSEQRFRAALATATGDDALILQTQIARSFGLRKDFVQARAILESVEPPVRRAGAEARVRYALELGRTHASATHPPETQTAEAQAAARRAFDEALALAREARLDALAIDAIHMFAFIDTAPAEQLKWAEQALAVVEASTQPAAKAWEASIRNNLGMALHGLGRLEAALAQFEQALALRERSGPAERVRVARWMVAWTFRAMKRDDEALAIQLRLEREADAAAQPDPYVFEELEILYRSRGQVERAAAYAERRKALAP